MWLTHVDGWHRVAVIAASLFILAGILYMKKYDPDGYRAFREAGRRRRRPTTPPITTFLDPADPRLKDVDIERLLGEPQAQVSPTLRTVSALSRGLMGVMAVLIVIMLVLLGYAAFMFLTNLPGWS